MAPIWMSAKPSYSARTPIRVAIIPPPISSRNRPTNSDQVAHTNERMPRRSAVASTGPSITTHGSYCGTVPPCGTVGAVGSVQSVERAFSVLRCLAAGPAGVTEIADRCDLPKSTVSRLLATLNEIDVVEQMGAGGDYRLGATIVELASGLTPSAHLVALARPHLRDLSEQIGEATGLSVLDGRQVHYLDQVDGPHAVQVRDWTGERVPAHLVPSGIVLLAAGTPAERDRYLAGSLEATTPRSMTDRKRLRERLDRVAKTGLEWVHDEF